VEALGGQLAVASLVLNVEVKGLFEKEADLWIRVDLAEAGNIWNKMNETLRSKKVKSRIEIER
jgi:hypothetical protein